MVPQETILDNKQQQKGILKSAKLFLYTILKQRANKEGNSIEKVKKRNSASWNISGWTCLIDLLLTLFAHLEQSLIETANQKSYFKMSVGASSRRGQPPLVDDLLQYGQGAFNPELSEEIRRPSQEKFYSLVQRYLRANLGKIYTNIEQHGNHCALASVESPCATGKNRVMAARANHIRARKATFENPRSSRYNWVHSVCSSK